jgi:hypothetical protein
MKLMQFVSMGVLSVACSIAWADGGGMLYHDGVSVKFTSAYAYAVPDPFDKSKQAVVIVMSDTPMDAATFDAAPDRDRAFSTYMGNSLRDGNSVQITLGPDKDGQVRVEQVNTRTSTNGEFSSSSGSTMASSYKLDLKRNDGKRLEGTYLSTRESEKTEEHGQFFDLHFALDVASGPAFGPGLPPDGGEPYKAYEAYAGAVRHAIFSLDQDSYQAFINTLTDGRIKVLNKIKASAGKDKAEDAIRAELKSMEKRIPGSYRFARGRVNGDVATIEVAGKGTNPDGSAGAAVSITVTMKKEKDEWYFDNDGQPAAADKSKPAAAGKGKAKSS